jgi:hypothetical protein
MPVARTPSPPSRPFQRPVSRPARTRLSCALSRCFGQCTDTLRPVAVGSLQRVENALLRGLTGYASQHDAAAQAGLAGGLRRRLEGDGLGNRTGRGRLRCAACAAFSSLTSVVSSSMRSVMAARMAATLSCVAGSGRRSSRRSPELAPQQSADTGGCYTRIGLGKPLRCAEVHLYAGSHNSVADAIDRARSRVGKAMAARIDRIAAKPALTAAETAERRVRDWDRPLWIAEIVADPSSPFWTYQPTVGTFHRSRYSAVKGGCGSPGAAALLLWIGPRGHWRSRANTLKRTYTAYRFRRDLSGCGHPGNSRSFRCGLRGQALLGRWRSRTNYLSVQASIVASSGRT